MVTLEGSRYNLIIVGLILTSSLVGSLMGYRYAESLISPNFEDLLNQKEDELADIQVRLAELESNMSDYTQLQDEVDKLNSDKLELLREISVLRDYIINNGIALPISYVDSSTKLDEILGLNPETVTLLEKNGFVVVDYPSHMDDFEQAYEWEFDNSIPVFITSDTLLHLYHIQFGETLKSVEEDFFFDYIWNLSQALFNNSYDSINGSDGTAREAHRRNAAYYAVALSLLKPKSSQVIPRPFYDDTPDFVEYDLTKYNFTIPDTITDLVTPELELVHNKSGLFPSPIFMYYEDYTQYQPRGHYTDSEKLKNYFKAFMWYGRLSMLLKGNPDLEPGQTITYVDEYRAIISEYDAEVQTLQACYASAYLSENPELWAIWNKIYEITSFYVGTSDDLGPQEYIEAMETLFGIGYNPALMTNDNLTDLKIELAEYRSPAIYGGTGKIVIDNYTSPENLDEILGATKGFRFMGQRYVPDSYIFQELVYPSVGDYLGTGYPFTFVSDGRGFPRGLDVMSLLGSHLAMDILVADGDTEYQNYGEQYQKLVFEFGNLTEADWNKNLYWSWLYTLKPLLSEYGDEYPSFMRTEAWRGKQLNAALASWTELRHDTILYAKQSYSERLGNMTISNESRGYVEPVPEFYNRLLNLTKSTRTQLEEWDILEDKASSRLVKLEDVLKRLLNISLQELAGEELSSDDYTYLQRFYTEIKGITFGINNKDVRVPLVADVHTETYTGQVLEEGTGNLRLLIAAVEHPDGSTVLTAGPVMTYYEFKHPMNDRLTDDAWIQKLAENPPDDPEWVYNYSVIP